jgi:hypothetical protein
MWSPLSDLLLVLLVFNILILIVTVIKAPALDEQTINQETEETLSMVNLDTTTRSSLATRSMGPTEAEKVLVPENLQVFGRPKSIS